MNSVILKRDWFDPEGRMWRTRDNPHSMPWGKKDLPSDAKCTEKEEPKAKKEEATKLPPKL